MLVYQEGDSFVARVADFGHSTFVHAESVRIKMPYSIPWYAPEVRNNWGDPSLCHAKRMDLFSFGLLCLWVLFNEDIPQMRIPEDNDQAPKFENLPTEFIIIECWKFSRRLPDLAGKLVASKSTLDDSVRQRLVAFFHGTITHDPAGRCEQLDVALSLLSSSK